MKNNVNKSNDISCPAERKEEKKRYKLRKVEEQEAKQEIEDFLENENSTNVSDSDQLNGFRPIGRECR